MLIYAIGSHHAALSKIDGASLKIVPVEVKSYGKNSYLSLDQKYMVEKYGFPLSGYERDHFNTHFEIWKNFRNSDEPFCMVINENARLKSPEMTSIGKLNEILISESDWDIYFPFEKSAIEDEDRYESGYLLGCYWGVDIYFISQKGAEKLLNINIIRQPLDEEILTQSISGELEVYCEEVNCFDFQENMTQKKARRLAIKEAIFQSEAWSATSKQMIQNLMHTVSILANQNKVDLILCDGSLLGQVRHGGIMPWDDDVDLALNGNEYESFVSLLNKDTALKHGVFYWGDAKTPYHKIWDENGQSIPGYDHKFPFVDIWLYKEADQQIIFDAGTTYNTEIYYPFSDVAFEGSIFKLPAQPQKCLDVSYTNWKTKIQVFPWSHQHEQDSVKPLSYDIAVDQTGRIIDE